MVQRGIRCCPELLSPIYLLIFIYLNIDIYNYNQYSTIKNNATLHLQYSHTSSPSIGLKGRPLWVKLQTLQSLANVFDQKRPVYLQREIFSKSYQFKPKSDFIYYFPIHLKPNGRPFVAKLIRKW